VKRVGIIVIVLAIAASAAFGLSRDAAATRRSLKAAEFNLRRSSTDALVCEHVRPLEWAAHPPVGDQNWMVDQNWFNPPRTADDSPTSITSARRCR
jgi:hypothetical protein